MKSFLPLLFWWIAAILVGEIVAMSGTQTTIDAWILTLTIVGNDVGDRMVMAAQMVFHGGVWTNMAVKAYLAGHSLLEEIFKFIAFLIVIRITRPYTIRSIIFSGILVGVGFALVENYGYFSHGTLQQGVLMLIIRIIGHALFTGIIASLYALGHFAQMRWIDAGAREGFSGWIVGHGEKWVEIFWTLFGVFSAAVVHAAINTFAALGGQTTAIAVMMMGWAILVHFMTKAESTRPYGTYIHQVDLLKTITDAEHELVGLKSMKNSTGLQPERKLFAHAFRRKLVKNQKQFAKT